MMMLVLVSVRTLEANCNASWLTEPGYNGARSAHEFHERSSFFPIRFEFRTPLANEGRNDDAHQQHRHPQR